MKARIVTLREIGAHGGILSADHYIANPAPHRERVAVLEKRLAAIQAELSAERALLARREAGHACDDLRHRRGEGA